MAHVSLQGVRKSFDSLEILHGIDCEIEDGEFIVILGPSGCGKSTLLRVIAGLETLSGGTVTIGEKIVNELEPADRDIAMVFQNYALYPHMTVYKNMAYSLKIRGLSKTEIEQRVQDAAKILELGDLLHRKPRQLSGGQRQRVAMGRCIVREPKVFLFDEPLSNLDAKLRVQMRFELRQLHESLKITSIYVTHDQVEAMTLADRLIVMDGGNAAQIGSPLEVYEQPMTKFVAGFIGSPAINFFNGKMSGDGSQVELVDSTCLSLGKNGLKKHGGSEVTLGIRPEDFKVVEDDQAMIHLQVDMVETLGADTLIHGHLGKIDTDFIVRLSGTHHLKRGIKLPLSVSPEKLHFFESQNGNRIQN
ncbi:MAG: sn-glycerol-3-phosphate import ATP-binding protein UgpC [SAR324 cluster bacterium]|nr:sn-glycerol-3-phosphate import ATP-binding protein UgpC [SAR324 cluster bacterium]